MASNRGCSDRGVVARSFLTVNEADALHTLDIGKSVSPGVVRILHYSGARNGIDLTGLLRHRTKLYRVGVSEIGQHALRPVDGGVREVQPYVHTAISRARRALKANTESFQPSVRRGPAPFLYRSRQGKYRIS